MTAGPDSRTMNACVLHAIGDMRYEQVPRPQPGPGQVLLRIAYCGVCGSDIPRVFVKGTYHFPTIIGHEFAGVVEAAGSGVTDVAPGDRMAVFPLLWCGHCPPCEQGKYVQCLNYDYLGSRRDGAFAEFVVAPRQNLVRVPAGVSLAEAAMTEPAAVALHALRRAGGCGPGDNVAIFGAGPIGLMVAQWARAMGASRIFIFDIVPQKLALAGDLGFMLTFNNRETDPAQVIARETGRDGVNLVIEAAGVPATFGQALAVTGRGGKMVILGNPAADVTLPAGLISQAMRREVAILGTWNSEYSATGNSDDWQTVLAAMASGQLNLTPLITHRVPLSEAFDALTMMRDQRDFYAKVLISPGGFAE